MKVTKPQLTALFEQQVMVLDEAGVTPTPAQSVCLWQLCQNCIESDGEQGVPFQSPAVTIPFNITLRPITVQAHLWVQQVALDWFASDPNMERLMWAWAMAHGHKENAFDGMQNRSHVEWVLFGFGMKVGIPFEKLEEVIYGVEGFEQTIEVEDHPSYIPSRKKAMTVRDWGRGICKVASHYSLTPEKVSALPLTDYFNLIRNMGDDPDKEPDTRARIEMVQYVQHLVRGTDIFSEEYQHARKRSRVIAEYEHLVGQEEAQE